MYFFYEHKRLIILLSILGALILGCGIYGFVFWNSMKQDEKNAQQRASVHEYIMDPANWKSQGDENLIHVLDVGYYTDDVLNDSFADTDGDTYRDKYEILVGSDPNVYESFGIDNKVSYDMECYGAMLHLEGTPDIASTHMNINNFNTMRNAGFGSRIFEITLPLFEEAVYDSELVINVNIPEGQQLGDAVINKISPNGDLTPVHSFLDVNNQTISCAVDESASYVVVFEDLLDAEVNEQPVVSMAIDDSASMFYFNGDDDCNSDPDGLRFDFCAGIVNELGENSLIHMNYFTGNVFQGFDFEMSDSEKKKIIDNLKTVPEDEHNFTGTALGSALSDSVSKVKSVSNPNKFIICLTDGVSSEGYDTWDHNVNECIKSGITLIIIGLGDNVDTERMVKAASSTGGYFLNVKTADCIETVAGSITNVISKRGIHSLKIVNEDGDENFEDVYLVADTGFSATKHGLKYSEYDVHFSAGDVNYLLCNQSYGIAETVREIYMGVLPEEGTGAKKAETQYIYIDSRDGENLSDDVRDSMSIPVVGYSLSLTKNCSDIVSLGDIDIPIIAAVNKYNESLSSSVVNGINLSVVDGVLTLDESVIPSAIKSNPELFYAEIIELADEQSFVLMDKSAELKFNKYIIYHPSLNAFFRRSASNPSDNYFIQTIYSMMSKKQTSFYTETRFNSSVDNDAMLNDLAVRLQSGDPVVISVDTTCGRLMTETNHNMNAIALYRDCNNAYTYYLKCYDSENPGVPYIYMIDTSEPDVYVFTDLWQNRTMHVMGVVS